MWNFSDLNSTCNLWPPESRQQQPKFIGCFSRNGDNLFPSFGVQGSSLHLNSDFISPPNLQAFNPANSSSGMGVTTPTKRYLVFDHSGDKRNLMFCYMEIPFQTLNPTLPASNATYALTSNYQEEMHEDTEEIDALLYSDSEFSFDSEEDSTAHSPLDMEEEEVASSPIPAKRRRLDLSVSDLDVSLMDTASSARAPSSQLPGDKSKCGKLERIQTIINILQRTIPGGKAMDAASVLVEAIRYLKSLKLQANALGATTPSEIGR